jgi:type V secretory pathway adhesin AidA
VGAALVALTVLGGCATYHQSPGRPIEERPRPPQPPAEPPAAANTTPDSAAPAPPPSMTPSGEENVRTLVARDTTAVAKVLARCNGKTLMAEQESTYDATLQLLAQTRAALARGDLAHARSLARNARQLVTSLDCQ